MNRSQERQLTSTQLNELVYEQNEWLEACISFVKEDNEV